MTPIHILSLGAGVQSSTMALMAALGEIKPMPTAAIFADTQAEQMAVYKWLEWLEKQLPFPVIRVSKGDMTSESLRRRECISKVVEVCKRCGAKKDLMFTESHIRTCAHTETVIRKKTWTKSLIPAFIKNPDGKRGIMGRSCTYDYKVMEIQKAARKLGGIKRGQKTVGVIQWIGISIDEAHRMKPSRIPWSEHRYPLIDLGVSRTKCIEWMKDNGFPNPPRSACVYCPFHSDAEWRRLKTEEPSEFERAVVFERELQRTKAESDNLRGVPYLHGSLVPLDQVDFRDSKERGQGELFGNDCTGMCGV